MRSVKLSTNAKSRKLILYAILPLFILALGYLAIQIAIQNQRVEYARQIEMAVDRDCAIGIGIDVEPDSVPIYDVMYWSSIEDHGDMQFLVTCYAPRDEWQCICEPQQ